MKTIKSKKKKWIVLGALVLIVVGGAIAAISLSKVSVESALVEKGEVVRLVEESGVVATKNSVIVAAKNGGEIKSLLAEEGAVVNAGKLLLESDIKSAQMDIKSLESQLSGVQTQYLRAKSLADKNKVLYEEGALSNEEYNASVSAAKQLAAEVSALSYTIKSNKEARGSSGVTAPITGTITDVFVQKGETVAAGAPLFEISDLSQLYIKVELIAEDADLVQTGDIARVYNEDSGFSDKNGSVRKIYTKAEEELSELGINQRRVTVEIALTPGAKLRLGSDMDVEITVDKKESVLRISDEALFEKEGKDYVYVIENEKAVLRQVELGLEGEDYAEVLSGLSEGETLIVSPGDDVDEGVKVSWQR